MRTGSSAGIVSPFVHTIRITRHLILLVKIVLLIGLAWYAFRKIDLDSAWATLAAIPASAVIAALVMLFLQFVIGSYRLRELLGWEPSLTEISAKTGKPLKEVKRLMSLHTKCYSADQPVGDDSEFTVVDSIVAARADEPEQRLTVQDLKGNVEVWLGRLSHRHRDVVARRYGLLGHQDGTLEQVGADVGITRERVRQLQIEALGKLRRMMERDGFEPEFLQDL